MTKATTIRIPEDLLEDIEAARLHHPVNVTGICVEALRRYVAEIGRRARMEAMNISPEELEKARARMTEETVDEKDEVVETAEEVAKVWVLEQADPRQLRDLLKSGLGSPGNHGEYPYAGQIGARVLGKEDLNWLKDQLRYHDREEGKGLDPQDNEFWVAFIRRALKVAPLVLK